MYKSKTKVMKISVKSHCPKRDALRPVDEFSDLDSIICIHTIPLS